MAQQQQQRYIAHHPVHLLAKDGGAAQGLEESSEGPREPGVLDDFLPSFCLCSAPRGCWALPSPFPSQAILLQYSDAPELMLKQTRVQKSINLCNMRLPEGLICPMRTSSHHRMRFFCHTVLNVPVPQKYAILHNLTWNAVCVTFAASIYTAAGVNTSPAALGRSGMPCAECTMVSARMGSSQSPSQGHAETADWQDEMRSARSHTAQLFRKQPVRRPKVKTRTSRRVSTCTSYRLLYSTEASDDAQAVSSPASVSNRNMHQTS